MRRPQVSSRTRPICLQDGVGSPTEHLPDTTMEQVTRAGHDDDVTMTAVATQPDWTRT